MFVFDFFGGGIAAMMSVKLSFDIAEQEGGRKTRHILHAPHLYGNISSAKVKRKAGNRAVLTIMKVTDEPWPKLKRAPATSGDADPEHAYA